MKHPRRSVRPSQLPASAIAATAPAKPKKKRSNGEELKQQAVIEWGRWIRIPAARDIEAGARVTDYLFAIPNGGSRHKAEAARLKATGVKAGVHDLMLPIARNGYHGLWVEMKHGKNTLSDDQEAWGERMRLAGYFTVTAWTSYDAEKAIAEYLGITMF